MTARKLLEESHVLVPALQQELCLNSVLELEFPTKFTSRTLSVVSDVRISTCNLPPAGRNMSRDVVWVAMSNVFCKQKGRKRNLHAVCQSWPCNSQVHDQRLLSQGVSVGMWFPRTTTGEWGRRGVGMKAGHSAATH